MKLSIVITYFNRRQQLINTLKSINYFKGNYDVEVIIVDDESEQSIDDVVDLFSLNIHLIKLKNRTLHEAVTPLNTGFNEVTGDVILINCAECFHMGDIIGYVFKNMREKMYFNFGTYSIDFALNEKFNAIDWDGDPIKEAHSIIHPTHELSEKWKDGDIGWYVNDDKHYSLLPFCAALSRSSVEELSGLDERFVHGTGFADVDFWDRIVNLKLETQVIMHPFCVHQAHKPTFYDKVLFQRNKDLLTFLRSHFSDRIKSSNNNYYAL